MGQKVIPLFNDSIGTTKVAAQIAAAAKVKMNEVFVAQPVVRTSARTS